MKKNILLALLLAVPTLGFAQFNGANMNAPKSHVGARLGIGLSMYNLEEPRPLITPVVGLDFDYKIARIPLYFKSGVYYMDMGSCFRDFKRPYHLVTQEYPNGRPQDKMTHTLHNHSIMIPAGISYHIYLSDNMILQPFSGFYLSYGMSNSQADIGLQEGVGMSFGKYYTNFGINVGLVRQDGEVEVDYIYKLAVEKCLHSSIFLNIGYNF